VGAQRSSSGSAPPGRRWTPESLRPWKERRRLAYVVIDEIESNFVGLSVSPWPTVDEVGRLRFGPGRSRSVGTTRADLERFLARHRLPRKGAKRRSRIGDVFAVAVREPPPEGQLAEPAGWMDPPVYDITVEARDAAKAAFYSAVAPTLDRERKADQEIVALAANQRPVT
jgi:hypothetical protein